MYTGILAKMNFDYEETNYSVNPRYYLNFSEGKLELNDLIGQRILLCYTGRIVCSSCGRETKKSFGQGYCYPCFISVPQTEDCVLKPELCRAHVGIARNMEYARENCLVDQCVYLANSGGLKVGVTRLHQIPVRWVDQGAVTAVKLVITPNRYNAGLVEVELKKVFADKTNWRKMLTGSFTNEDLLEKKKLALDFLQGKGFQYTIAQDQVYTIVFPVARFPVKVESMNFDNQVEISGTLLGIKGQYLIFDDGRVFNVRKHTGYCVNMILS